MGAVLADYPTDPDLGAAPEAKASSGGPASILKAAALLNAFEGEPSLSLAQLSDRVSMPKSTVFRLLRSLADQGMVEKIGDRYQLGRRLHALGQHALGGEPSRLLNAGLPLMTELQHSTGLIVNLAWLQGFDVAYLATLRTRESPSTPAVIGQRLPAHCTALGKVLLAYTPRERWAPHMPRILKPLTARSIATAAQLGASLAGVRSEGVAVESQESSPHLACLAVPVLRRGEAVAGLSVSGAPGSLDIASLRGALKRAALHIGRSVAWPS